MRVFSFPGAKGKVNPRVRVSRVGRLLGKLERLHYPEHSLQLGADSHAGSVIFQTMSEY